MYVYNHMKVHKWPTQPIGTLHYKANCTTSLGATIDSRVLYYLWWHQPTLPDLKPHARRLRVPQEGVAIEFWSTSFINNTVTVATTDFMYVFLFIACPMDQRMIF